MRCMGDTHAVEVVGGTVHNGRLVVWKIGRSEEMDNDGQSNFNNGHENDAGDGFKA